MYIGFFMGGISKLWQSQRVAIIWCLLAHVHRVNLCSLWMCDKPEDCPSD